MKSRPATEELSADTLDVLVVDDDASLRDRMVRELKARGVMAIAAGDGAAALRLARDRHPRLILLDLEMPVMNGWQFLEHRRSDRALARIPVIVLGPPGSPWPVWYDIAGRLDKPIEEELLLEEVERVLLESPASTFRQSAPPILLLVIEDDEDTRTSVAELLEEHGYQVGRASNGQEAEAYLRRNPRPDCIVLDLWMPVMDGWQFTSRLQQPGVAPIPIVVITAAEPYWGYPVPAAFVVRKPINPEAFLAKIAKLVAAANGASDSSVSGA
jgi:two-component system sensor histidine kinase/response regulator